MKLKIALIAALAAALSGCQYKAQPLTVATYNVYSSYDGKLPGKYLLFVDGSNLSKEIKPSDLNCAAHSFPLDLKGSFASSVRQTFANLVTELEMIYQPVDRTQLKARNARGMIIVKGEQLEGRLRVVPGFWSAGMETQVEIAASITVDEQNGRLLGSTVSGNGNGNSDAGAFCAGGANSLVQSAEAAMKQTLGRLGEALTNSDRVRRGS